MSGHWQLSDAVWRFLARTSEKVAQSCVGALSSTLEPILIIYRDLTQEQLDHEYNVRAGIPDYQDIFDRWKHDSAEFRASSVILDEIEYGQGKAQSIDIFKTERRGEPLVVFIHGGYWQSLDKSDFSYIARPYIEDGLNFAAINYRLAPTVSMAEIVSDVRDALVWLYRNATAHGYDAERIFVTGSSAGGHLTAVSLSTDWREFGAPANMIKGGCALSGLYDLEPIRLCYLNEKVRLNSADAHKFSPVHHIPSSASPLILAVGGDESTEFHRQQESYADAWRASGLSCTVIEQTNGHHFDMCDRLGDPSSAVYRSVVEMTRTSKALERN